MVLYPPKLSILDHLVQSPVEISFDRLGMWRMWLSVRREAGWRSSTS